MKKINLAVASALLAVASSANAGISIPAGEWTVDIGGNVNAFYIHNSSNDNADVRGGAANAEGQNGSSTSSVNTGLLPSWLGIGAKTRQNDLDVAWTISFQPGASSAHGLQGGSGSEFRQAFLTFGDKSWGSIKIGKDLGLFGSNAILNDQTLLGVGAQGIVGAKGGTTTTLGRIGTGFLYADFKGQINYTTPNFNGLSATVGIAQPWGTVNLAGDDLSGAASGNQKAPAFEGQVQYEWAGDVSGKVWAEFLTQKVDGIGATAATKAGFVFSPVTGSTAVAAAAANPGEDERATVWGVGASVNVAGVGLVGYYYDGKGAGTTSFLGDGFTTKGKRRDSDGYYVQASYALPGIGTKLAASYGESNLDDEAGDSPFLVKSNEMWVVGAYHPLTKHLNLVAEYSKVEAENQAGDDNKSDIISLGAIMFF